MMMTMIIIMVMISNLARFNFKFSVAERTNEKKFCKSCITDLSRAGCILLYKMSFFASRQFLFFRPDTSSKSF